MNVLTNSRASTYLTCQKKHHLRYELGLVADREPGFLALGRWIHHALDMHQKGREPEELLEDPWERARGRAIVRFVLEYDAQPVQLIATELEFKMPLRNRWKRHSTTWRFGGVIDGVGWRDGSLVIVERKTTSSDLKAHGPFEQRLMLDPQALLYAHAVAEEMNMPVETILYQAIRRPMWKKRDLTPDEFEERVFSGMEEEPGKWMRWIERPVFYNDVQEAIGDFWEIQKNISASRKHHRWPRNRQACRMWSPCPYIDICGDPNPIYPGAPPGFIKLDDVHPELVNNVKLDRTELRAEEEAE